MPGGLLLGMVTFFFSVVPVGPPHDLGVPPSWLFQQGQIGWAIFMAAWGSFWSAMVDNVIKPFIISRGSNLPFAVVFLGVLGRVLSFGCHQGLSGAHALSPGLPPGGRVDGGDG